VSASLASDSLVVEQPTPSCAQINFADKEKQMAKNIDREIRRILRDEALHEESLNPPRSAALVRCERDGRKVLDKALRQSGLDTKALETMRANYQRESLRSTEKLKRLVSKQSIALRKGVVAQAKSLRAIARRGAGPLPGAPATIVLDQAQRIVTFPHSDVLTSSRISPGDNFARILVKRKDRTHDRLTFVFMWRNTNQDTSIIDADATLSVNGMLNLHTNDGWGGNVGFIDVSTRMSVHRFLLPFGGVSGPVPIRSILAFNYPWWTAQDAAAPISTSVAHSVRGFPLAGNALLMVTVSLTVFSDFDDGRGLADFSSGNFGVGVPQVTLGVNTAQNVFVAKR
jgi:hypothetical protein